MSIHPDEQRSRRIRVAVGEYLSRRATGEPLSETEFLAQYPELLPELKQELVQRRGTVQEDKWAREVHEEVTLVAGVGLSPAQADGSTSSKGLQIRCPQCNTPVMLASDTPWTRIGCPSCGGQFSLVGDDGVATQNAATLRRIGHFELIERLGVGGFGTVWKARDTMLDRTVAIKFPRKGELTEEETDQFLREARTAAQLTHPHIVSVHEVGRDQDTIYIVSDFVRGVELSEWITSHRPTHREAAQMCRQLAQALHHAHAMKVVHRDVKPGNIMVDAAGSPHIMDFGLAKRAASEVSMTLDGQIVGTPAYMSPEQARGDASVDARSDIYSVGVILFQMLTGELPFRGNARMLIFQVLHEDPPNPRTLNNTIPRDLETICLRCMEKDRTSRYETANELADELGRFLEGEPIHARAMGRMARTARLIRKNPVVASLMGLIFGLLVVGTTASTYLAVRYRHQAQRTKEETEKRFAEQQEMGRRGSYNRQLMEAMQNWRFDPQKSLSALNRDDLCADDLRDFTWRLASRCCCPEGYLIDDFAGTVPTVLYAPDGSYLAAYDGQAWIRIYDPLIGKERQAIRVADRPVAGPSQLNRAPLALSGGSRPQVALRLTEQTIGVWDVDHATQSHQLSEPGWRFEQFAMDPLGQKLAAILYPDDGPPTQGTAKIVVWNLDTGDRPWEWDTNAEVRLLQFFPDGRRLVGANSQQIFVWQFDQGTPHARLLADHQVATGHINSVECIHFRQSSAVAYATHSGTVLFWDYQANKIQKDLPLISLNSGDRESVRHVRISPDGRRVAAWFKRNVGPSPITLWDTQSPMPRVLLSEHVGELECVSMSPDGHWIATAGSDGLILVRRAMGDGETMALTTDAVAFAYNPNPRVRVLATATRDQHVCVWNVDSGEKLRTLETHDRRIEHLVFSHDGRYLAASGRNNGIFIWTVDFSSPKWNLHEYVSARATRHIEFHSDPRQLIIHDQEGGVSVADWSNTRSVHELSLGTERASAVHVTASGSIAVGDTSGQVTIWDGERPRREGTLAPNEALGPVEGIAVWESPTSSPDPAGQQSALLAAYHRATPPESAGRVVLYDLRERICRGSISLPRDTEVSSMAFAPDGQSLAIASGDRAVHFFDVQTRAPRVVFGLALNDAAQLAFAPQGDTFAIRSQDGTIRIWKAGIPPTSGKELFGNLNLSRVIHAHEFCDDRHFIGPSPQIRSGTFYGNLARDEFMKPLSPPVTHGAEMSCLTIDPTKRLLGIGFWNGTIHLWSLKDANQPLHLTPLSSSFAGRVFAMAFTADGALATDGQSIGIWSLNGDSSIVERSLLWAGHTHQETISALAVSPNHKLLATADFSGEIKLWSVGMPPQPVPFPGTASDRRIRAVRFSPDGSILASAGDDGRICLWDVAKKSLLHTLNQHSDRVYDIRFSPEGDRITSASHDGTINIWSTRSGTSLAYIASHQGPVYAISFDPAGRHFISSSADRSALYWDNPQP